jgi:hypothetical protein
MSGRSLIAVDSTQLALQHLAAAYRQRIPSMSLDQGERREDDDERNGRAALSARYKVMRRGEIITA